MLSKTEMKTLAGLGYDKAALLRLVARDIGQKGRSVLDLIEPEPVSAPAAPKAAAKARKLTGKPAAQPQTAAPKTQGQKASGEKRTLTAEAKANIVAAQKKRWATYHAQKIA